MGGSGMSQYLSLPLTRTHTHTHTRLHTHEATEGSSSGDSTAGWRRGGAAEGKVRRCSNEDLSPVQRVMETVIREDE